MGLSRSLGRRPGRGLRRHDRGGIVRRSTGAGRRCLVRAGDNDGRLLLVPGVGLRLGLRLGLHDPSAHHVGVLMHGGRRPGVVVRIGHVGLGGNAGGRVLGAILIGRRDRGGMGVDVARVVSHVVGVNLMAELLLWVLLGMLVVMAAIVRLVRRRAAAPARPRPAAAVARAHADASTSSAIHGLPSRQMTVAHPAGLGSVGTQWWLADAKRPLQFVTGRLSARRAVVQSAWERRGTDCAVLGRLDGVVGEERSRQESSAWAQRNPSGAFVCWGNHPGQTANALESTEKERDRIALHQTKGLEGAARRGAGDSSVDARPCERRPDETSRLTLKIG